MATEVAGLAVKIDSTDAIKAAENLDKVTAAGEKTEGAAKRVQRSWEQAIERVAAEANGLNSRFNTLNGTQGRMLAAVERIASQMDKMSAAMDRTATQTSAAARAADQNAAAISKVEKEAQKAAATFSHLEISTKGSGEAAIANLNTMTRFEQTLGKAATQSNTMTQAATKNADALDKVDKGAKGAATGLDSVAKKADEAEKASKLATSSLEEMAAAIGSIVAVSKLWGQIQQATLDASRYEQLGVIMYAVGTNTNHARSQLDEMQQSLQSAGISMMQSREVITKMMQAQIDLGQATDLARLAQDAATIGNLSSSDALGQLIHGIQSAQTEVLRNIGLNVQFEAGYKGLAESLGKATTSLTENEKMQSRVNAVMERATSIAGAYEGSMDVAVKQMGSMERLLENLSVLTGKAFQPAFKLGIDGANVALGVAGKNTQLVAAGLASVTAAAAIMTTGVIAATAGVRALNVVMLAISRHPITLMLSLTA